VRHIYPLGFKADSASRHGDGQHLDALCDQNVRWTWVVRCCRSLDGFDAFGQLNLQTDNGSLTKAAAAASRYHANASARLGLLAPSKTWAFSAHSAATIS
jgi:hypothetical protein